MTPAVGGASMFSAVASLVVILGLLVAVALVARKLRDGTWVRRKAGQSEIKIIATRSIGVQSSLLIVEAEGQRFLIGAGRTGLTAIGALNGIGPRPRPAETVP